ncbi:MAG: hypothetical protein JXP73_03470 [Deltaproteobacteria bacterium]|nr:hypothetical protein [Deltaproteobacteria bacterium]
MRRLAHEPGLGAEEQVAQLGVDPDLAHEDAEAGKAAEPGQPRVRPPDVKLARVRATNAAAAAISISALASERISTRLLGAWRG